MPHLHSLLLVKCGLLSAHEIQRGRDYGRGQVFSQISSRNRLSEVRGKFSFKHDTFENMGTLSKKSRLLTTMDGRAPGRLRRRMVCVARLASSALERASRTICHPVISVSRLRAHSAQGRTDGQISDRIASEKKDDHVKRLKFPPPPSYHYHRHHIIAQLYDTTS